jgi:hypothetical protein
MTEDVQGPRSKRNRLWLALALLVAILAVLVVPPMVSIARYKTRITQLMSASLNRPVHLSSVELRLLPRPGFVLSDLTVDEDPGYGAEPLLHANTVTASIRLLSLWRGRLVIDTISVDEASLNLTRNQAGRWNLDSLFHTAANRGVRDAKRDTPLPYLEATNSRINVKNGSEKLPFSLMNTDVSFWQQNPGDWRIRLRGQPARTDTDMGLGDTGVVRLEARLQRAPELRQVPIHLDLDWKEAQLGQLSRLVLGSDPGWRGDLTGELHLDGTAESAQIKTRLRAEGVHRAEFAPAAPLDFDARCGLVYHFSARILENLVCDSPLGNGKIRVAANMPGGAGQPRFSVELDRIPVAAALDALRTVRNDFGPGLEAKGSISGKIAYAPLAPPAADPATPKGKQAAAKMHGKAVAAAPGPLTGSFAVDGFELGGASLGDPIRIPKITLDPVAVADGEAQAIVATMVIPAGGAGPLTVSARLSASGYQLSVHGQASINRARELVKVTGATDANLLDAVAGEPLTADLTAEGPWVPAAELPFNAAAAVNAGSATPGVVPAADRLSGSITLHNSNWKADYLANAVMISTATAHFDGGATRWDPVVFSYGPVKGSANVSVPRNCTAPQPCLPVFEMQFAQLDASALEAAILGSKEKVTLISTLLDKLRPTAAPALPEMEGTVKAQTLVLGPLTVKDATASVRILNNGAHITSLDAATLGGKMHAAGSLYTAASDKDKPQYMFEAQFQKVNPGQLGQLVGQRWAGGALDASGKVELSGFTEKDLVESARGTLHFDWEKGAVNGGSAAPAELARFNKWSADAVIGNGMVTLTQNQVERAGHKSSVQADATLGTAAKVRFAVSKETQAKR